MAVSMNASGSECQVSFIAATQVSPCYETSRNVEMRVSTCYFKGGKGVFTFAKHSEHGVILFAKNINLYVNRVSQKAAA